MVRLFQVGNKTNLLKTHKVILSNSLSSSCSSVVLCSFVLLVYIVVLVLVVCLFTSSVNVVATFSGTVLFPLLCSVLPFFV